MAIKRPRDLNLHLLPPQLRDLVKVMGEAAALRLVEHRGGTPLVVPVRCTADHWLNDVVGPVAFGALVAECASITMDLPKYDSVMRQWRHQQVQALCRTGLPDAQVALRTGYTRRHVINIRQAEAEAAGAQWDLFDNPPSERVDGLQDELDHITAHNPFGLARGAARPAEGSMD